MIFVPDIWISVIIIPERNMVQQCTTGLAGWLSANAAESLRISSWKCLDFFLKFVLCFLKIFGFFHEVGAWRALRLLFLWISMIKNYWDLFIYISLSSYSISEIPCFSEVVVHFLWNFCLWAMWWNKWTLNTCFFYRSTGPRIWEPAKYKNSTEQQFLAGNEDASLETD